jgi:hypothetical protein
MWLLINEDVGVFAGGIVLSLQGLIVTSGG